MNWWVTLVTSKSGAPEQEPIQEPSPHLTIHEQTNAEGPAPPPGHHAPPPGHPTPPTDNNTLPQATILFPQAAMPLPKTTMQRPTLFCPAPQPNKTHITTLYTSTLDVWALPETAGVFLSFFSPLGLILHVVTVSLVNSTDLIVCLCSATVSL